MVTQRGSHAFTQHRFLAVTLVKAACLLVELQIEGLQRFSELQRRLVASTFGTRHTMWST